MVIDLGSIAPEDLPIEVSVSAVTMAELSAGPAAARDFAERARRQEHLQRAEATFDPLPFDASAGRAYGRVYAAVVAHGRNPRRRLADLLIASTALADDLPVFTRNSADFVGLEDVIDVVAI